MIPLGDDLPTFRTPWALYLLLGITWLVWVFVQGAGFNRLALATSVCNLGMVPGELTHRALIGTAVPLGNGLACVVDNSAVNIFTPITSMFLHGSWEHILGNSIFFWVFGNNVEDSMGHGRFIVFYFVCGLIAAAVYILISPLSPVPTVGASGAISGILGAYLVLYPRARVNMFFFIFLIPIRAWLVLIWWFGWQLIAALPMLSSMRPDVSGGVAVWAHVGGFVAGVVLIKLFENSKLVAAHRAAVAQRYRPRWHDGY
ncbi:MAG TPA: rhomboid family intramembrane serine protease [Gemmatimonadaceae bacterium]|nr:rhomboid family intramembrane serine protease [Gemmatimonadaceae bacterium]